MLLGYPPAPSAACGLRCGLSLPKRPDEIGRIVCRYAGAGSIGADHFEDMLDMVMTLRRSLRFLQRTLPSRFDSRP